MQRQRHCCNHPLLSVRLIQSVFKGTGLQKKRRKIPKRLSPLIFFPLMYLVASTYNFLSTRARLIKRSKTTKKVLDVIEGKDKVIVMTSLQRVLMLMSSKRKKKISSKLSTLTAIEKDITPTSVFKIQRKSQKTSVSLGNLYAGDCN